MRDGGPGGRASFMGGLYYGRSQTKPRIRDEGDNKLDLGDEDNIDCESKKIPSKV